MVALRFLQLEPPEIIWARAVERINIHVPRIRPAAPKPIGNYAVRGYLKMRVSLLRHLCHFDVPINVVLPFAEPVRLREQGGYREM
jgi:hypothetical protein